LENKLLDPTAIFAAAELTIITSDLALFCDVNDDAHRTAARVFMDRIVPYFHALKATGVNIVVFKTGLFSLVNGEKFMTPDNDSALDDTKTSWMHERAMVKCIHSIQAEFRARSQLEFDSKNWAMAGNPVNVTISVVEHSYVGFKYLSRQWICSSLVGRRLRGRMQLSLPELPDGTQCSVSLEIEYQLLPFSTKSSDTTRLSNDLELLTSSTISVLQAIPLSSVDASQLYGVPMKVCAGLEADFHRYQEMEILTLSLFSYLHNEDLALLLSAESSKPSSNGLFHCTGQQAFLLLPQELLKSSGQSPQSGLLFRYARADDLFMEATTVKTFPSMDSDTVAQYADYVERAMNCVPVKPYNPLNRGNFEAVECETSNTKPVPGSPSNASVFSASMSVGDHKNHSDNANKTDGEIEEKQRPETPVFPTGCLIFSRVEPPSEVSRYEMNRVDDVSSSPPPDATTAIEGLYASDDDIIMTAAAGNDVGCK
jgi:hypothetical protein